MPIQMSIEIFGQEQVKRTIMRPSEHAKDARPVFRVILEILRQTERLRFRMQGPGWRPLKPATLAAKRGSRYPHNILMQTGALYESLTSPSAPGGIADIDRTSLHYGTRVVSKKGYPYPGAHQFGAPAANIPQRSVVDLGEGTKGEIVKVLQRYILTGEVLDF